jgi:hypothetical protein
MQLCEVKGLFFKGFECLYKVEIKLETNFFVINIGIHFIKIKCEFSF